MKYCFQITKKFSQIVLLLLYFAGLVNLPAMAQQWKLIEPTYPVADDIVAAYSVADYGATGDGVTDVTAIFQTRLNLLGALGGGVLFVPKGKYVIKGVLNIPKGITLCGELKKPVKGQPIEGTILMAYSGKGNKNASAFITMEPAAAVMDLAIWYPEQNPDNIVVYPPTLRFGKSGYFGNEYCNAKNVAFVNSYIGIEYNKTNGGAGPVVNGLYGTPLSVGIELDNIVDVGRLEWVDFSPSYWSGSGLPNSPAPKSSFEDWIYTNGTGIVMRRNDWSYTCYVNIEGYNKGYWAAPSISSPGAAPNGHHYQMTFTKCKTGIYFQVVNSVGILLSRINTIDCETGVFVGPGTSGAIEFHTCNFGGTNNAFVADKTSTTKIIMQQSVVSSGKVNISGGILSASDCDFNNPAPQVIIGANGRGLLTGNRFKEGVKITNNSIFTNIIDHTPVVLDKLPDFPVMVPETHGPSRMALYLATASPFLAKNDGTTDNTSAIQKALDQAAADGGGIVFLPPGKYKVLGNLDVPTGVELKGASDVSSVPLGPGSILEVYAGRTKPGDRPFLRLAPKSGIRGITFDYPEQVSTNLPGIDDYPYTIQGTGSDVYIINVGLRASVNGVDLFTYPCDNHYVDWVAGHVFDKGVKVGGGSQNGKISNLMFNLIVYACGSESKFGSWPNSPAEGNTPTYDYGFANLEFLILGNCKDEILYNDFHYGSLRGVVLVNDGGSGPTGKSLGLGIDGSGRSLCIEGAGTNGFDFINTQVVSIGTGNTNYLETSPTFTSKISLFNSDYWGSPKYGIVLNGGNLNLQQGFFANSGNTSFGNLTTGQLNLENSIVSTVSKLFNSGAEKRFGARSSILDPSGINKANCALWVNNMSNNVTLSPTSALSRTGWTAAASVNMANASKGIDGSASTRWDTSGSQVKGQWYRVDMKTEHTINEIILDVAGSPTDSPAGYNLYVSNDGITWGTAVATGVGTDGMTIIPITSTTARYIKIEQTGTKGNYWSIHEFYVFNISEEFNTSTNEIEMNAANGINFQVFPNPALSGKSIFVSCKTALPYTLRIFSVTGELISSAKSLNTSGTSIENYSLAGLKPGIYFLNFETSKGIETKKLIVK